jgi:hypothetical protein
LVVFESDPEAPAPLAVAEAEPPMPVELAVARLCDCAPEPVAPVEPEAVEAVASVRSRFASADCEDPTDVDCAERD